MIKEKVFNIKEVLEAMTKERNAFTLETDFNFILAYTIKKMYKNCDVIMEYEYPKSTCDERKYIDILVIIDGKWIPIEVKYKHQECKVYLYKDAKGECRYPLSNQSARTSIRESYYEDVKRIYSNKNEKVDNPHNKNKLEFYQGYAILVTNYSNFKTKDYENYKLNVKTIDQCNPKDENPIKEKYEMEWVPTKFYFQEDDKIDKTFDCLITTIK